MFLEPGYWGGKRGWIEVICGSMFSGKTEELIRRLRRAKIAGQQMGVFKPLRDERFEKEKVISHDDNHLLSVPVKNSKSLLTLTDGLEVVGIDEAQFFDEALPTVCQQLAVNGMRVIVAGLDMDYKGNPFGPIPQLLAVAEYITKVHAICPHCGQLATHSYRLSEEVDQIVLGAADRYEPRCRLCFEKGVNLPNEQFKEE